MADDPGQPSTQMPWPLRIWPLAVMAVAVTTALVLRVALIDSDVSRVALPVIAGAAATIALAVITVRLLPRPSLLERSCSPRLARTAGETGPLALPYPVAGVIGRQEGRCMLARPATTAQRFWRRPGR